MTDHAKSPKRLSQADAARTLAAFESYRRSLSELRGGPVLAGELPRDPAYLSCMLHRKGMVQAVCSWRPSTVRLVTRTRMRVTLRRDDSGGVGTAL